MTDRHAVYVIAHDEPRLFADLVASLRHRQIDVYAHIDARVAPEPFAAALATDDRVHFVADADRVPVRWGGFSVVSAVLSLIETAAATDVPYRRHTLVSGRDVLLRSVPDLLASWATDTEYVRIDHALRPGAPHAHKVTHVHFPDRPVLRRMSGRIRRRPPTHPLYQGSMWWSLTDDAMQIVRSAIADDPSWCADLRFALCPDEILVPSILKASPLADRIGQDYSESPAADHILHAQRFIDWRDDDASSPPELDDTLLAEALAGPALFARKVGPGWTWRVPS
ncbi:beta-1,6-N-acetylglucosaminyltransferase [Gordonia desulfuricans]|nr:beta-1,6-N-acetylglucosaminyltransferase [Gordonia desulfuricans]